MIVKTNDLPQAQQEIQDRLDSGLDYNTAACAVYQDVGCPVNDLDSWTDYQAIEGSMDDEHVVVSLQYVEEGLLTVDLVEGQGAFGDDLAIEILATEYQREIFVVSAAHFYLHKQFRIHGCSEVVLPLLMSQKSRHFA